MHSAALAQASGPALFGFEHGVVLALIVACAVVLSLILRRIAGRSSEPIVRRVICLSLAGVLGGGLAFSQIQQAAAGTWSIRESLPLHLCDIGVLVTAAALLGAAAGFQPGTRSIWQQLYELSYFWGLGGTVQALVTPDVEGTFPAASCVRYFAIHGALVVAVFVMTLGLRMRPLPGAVPRVWLVTFVLALVVLLINGAINGSVGLNAEPGANYMYLCGAPGSPTLYNLFGPWPWALLTLVLVGTLIFMLCYAPFWIIDLRHEWHTRSEEHSC